MATTKKPRKRYNRNQHLIRMSNDICHNSLILSIIKLANDGQVWVKNNIPQVRNKTRQQDYLFTFDVSRPWSFVFGVACRTPDGKTFLKFDYVELKKRYKFTSPEINAFVDSELQAVIARNNKEHIVSPFFIASPERKEYSDEFILRLLNWKQTFEILKTPYEVDNIRQKGMEELKQIDPIPYCSAQTWKILRQQGIQDFSDVRMKGLTIISQLKGIGKKRCEELIQGYRKLMNDYHNNPIIANLEEFEWQIHLHENAVGHLERATN